MKTSNILKAESSGGVSKIKINKNRDSAMLVQIEEQTSKKQLSIDEALSREQQYSKVYKQKNDRNTLKCRFLFSKLTTLGNLEGIPEMIASQSGQVQTKIKQLEQMLLLKRGEQMRKLRRKVKMFLNQINFQIEDSDLQKIQDELEFILFLIDIFEQKFKELTAERGQVEQIIKRLQIDKPVQDFQSALKSQEQMKHKIEALSAELELLRMEENQKNGFGLTLKDINAVKEGKDGRWQQLLSGKSLQIEKNVRRIQDLESELLQLRQRGRLLQVGLQRARRDEIKMKERYRLMEQSKNERIKLLQQNLKMRIQL